MNYRVDIVSWADAQAPLRAVRSAVFIEEQNVPVALEWDGEDELAIHGDSLGHFGCGAGFSLRGEPVTGHVLKREGGTHQIESAIQGDESQDQNNDGDKSHEDFLKFRAEFGGEISNDEEDRAGAEREG